MEHYVITIARSYGSDGCAIAARLSEALGINYYDKDLLPLVSEESGISEQLLAKSDEKVKKHLWEAEGDRKYELDFDRIDPGNPLSEYNLFRYQASTIRRLANRESCIIVGRAADYVLQHHRYLFSVSIQAPFESCVKGIMKRKFVDRRTAEKDVRRINKERNAFYRTYTGQEWNDPLNYDLCLNSARYPQPACVELIRTAASLKFGFTV